MTCAESVPDFIREGDLIVVKGSRAVHMDKVVDALVSAFEVRG